MAQPTFQTQVRVYALFQQFQSYGVWSNESESGWSFNVQGFNHQHFLLFAENMLKDIKSMEFVDHLFYPDEELLMKHNVTTGNEFIDILLDLSESRRLNETSNIKIKSFNVTKIIKIIKFMDFIMGRLNNWLNNKDLTYKYGDGYYYEYRRKILYSNKIFSYSLS